MSRLETSIVSPRHGGFLSAMARLAGPGSDQVFAPAKLVAIALLISPLRLLGVKPEWVRRLTHRIQIDDGAPPATMRRLHQMIEQIEALAEAKDWATISGRIREMEAACLADPLAERAYEAAAYAARMSLAEATMAAEYCNLMTIADIPLEVIADLEGAVTRWPDDHVLAAIAARAHVDVAWFHRGGAPADGVSDAGWSRMQFHYGRAERLIARFDAAECRSPLLAEAAYYLGLMNDDGGRALRAAYRRWSDLDPANLTPYMTHAFHLLPRWYGTYAELDDEARHAAARTNQLFGAAAYAAFYLSVLPRDTDAMAHVDADLFIEGLDDLMAFRKADQAWANRLCGTLAHISHPKWFDQIPAAARNRARLAAALGPFARRHLRVLHPSAWVGERPGALISLARAFSDDLIQGRSVRFSILGVMVR